MARHTTVKAFDHDTNGHVLLPKWFLGFVSAIAALLSIGVVPWATSISTSLGELSENMARLSTRLDGQVDTNNAALRGLQHRIERLESKLDRLDEWRRAASPPRIDEGAVPQAGGGPPAPIEGETRRSHPEPRNLLVFMPGMRTECFAPLAEHRDHQQHPPDDSFRS